MARSHQPLIVVIEDVQWADVGTLDVIREIATGSPTGPLLLALTHRHEPRSPELVDVLHELDRSGRTTRVKLNPLTRDEVAELLRGLPGAVDSANEANVTEILDRTGGNTLLVRELARALGTGSLELPETIRDLVDSFLLRCSSGAQMLAELGALTGRRFDADVAYSIVQKEHATIGGLGADRLVDSSLLVGELRQVGMVSPLAGAEVEFRHDLFRDCVLARLDASAQIRGHLALLTELESRVSDDLDALVLHSVGARHPAKAGLRLAERARRRLTAGLVDDAVVDAENALMWHGHDADGASDRHGETALTLADAYRLSGRRAEAKALLEAHTAPSDVVGDHNRIRFLTGMHRRLALLGIDERRLADAERDLARCVELIGANAPTEPSLVDEWIEVWLEIASLDYYTNSSFGWTAGASERVAEKVGIGGKLRHLTRLNQSINAAMLRSTGFSGPDEAIAFAFEHLRLAEELGDLAIFAESSFAVAFGYLCRLDGPNSWKHFDETAALYDRSGDRLWHGIASTYAAVGRRLSGNVEATETHSLTALEKGTDVLSAAYRAVLEANLAWAAIRRSESMSGEVQERWRTEAETRSRSTVGFLEHPAVAGFYPFMGFLVWPAMLLAHDAERREEISRFASLLVHPTAQALPTHVEAMLRAVVEDPTHASLIDVLAWARSMNLT